MKEIIENINTLYISGPTEALTMQPITLIYRVHTSDLFQEHGDLEQGNVHLPPHSGHFC